MACMRHLIHPYLQVVQTILIRLASINFEWTYSDIVVCVYLCVLHFASDIVRGSPHNFENAKDHPFAETNSGYLVEWNKQLTRMQRDSSEVRLNA